ncbi:MAG: polymerase subunit chi [Rhizobacter sp.]|nr:polymerase subunit chi [Rhizobacter sp.]
MTEVMFHFKVADKQAYACRLLRKAVRSGAKVTVVGPSALLGRLDQALWTFEPLDFVAHAWAKGGVLPERLKRSPLVLAESAAASPHHEVLVNLGETLCDGFEGYKRLIEVVSLDAEDRSAARQRWKHYADRGYAITQHEVAA